MHSFRTTALLTLLGGCTLLPLSSPAPLTAYLKIDEIKGESKAADHKEWIIIDGIVSGGLRERMIDGTPTGTREHKPLTVTKSIDKASPLLMSTLTTGETIPEVTFEATERYPSPDGNDPTADREEVYLRYTLVDVLVTSIDLASEQNDDHGGVPTETVGILPAYAEWHVRQLGPDGLLVDSAGAFFDIDLNESGPATIAPVIEQAENVEVAAGETVEVEIRIEDFDTPHLELDLGVESDPARTNIGPVKWMAPEMIRISLTTTTAASGQIPVTLRASDGENTSSMSFSVFVDSTGTPWDGFMMAYFTEEERADPSISSPIEDPDGDDLDTLLEFLLGANPREFTPVEIRQDGTGGGGGGGRIAIWPAYLDPDDDGDSIDIEFDRRVDDPRITLFIMASFDGGSSWTRLEPGTGENPLYKEGTEWKENAIYESVSGTIDPPDEATSTLLRFVGEME